MNTRVFAVGPTGGNPWMGALRICIGEHSVSGVLETGNGALCGFMVASAAGIGNHHGYVAKVRSMPSRGLYPYPHRHPNDGKSQDAAAVEGDIQRSANKSRHRRLVEHSLTCVSPVPDARFMHNKIRDSKIAVIDHASHIANLEQPDAFNRIVLEFLASVLPGVV